MITVVSCITYAQETDSSGYLTVKEKPAPVYKIRAAIDIPVTVLFDAYSVFAMGIIYGRESIPLADVLALDKNNINGFDRPIANNYSPNAKATSDLFFYGSMPLPLFLMIDKRIRRDGLKVGLMYLEALGTTGVLYTSSAMLANRYRPITYNPNVPIETRQSGGSKNSFFAGHPALVATSTFFMAKVYTDYHPNMKHKWVLYALAGSVTATTGYLRLKAGYHFTTDVITGVTVGTLVGILVPQIHKIKGKYAAKLTLLPNYRNGSGGFTALYKL